MDRDIQDRDDAKWRHGFVRVKVHVFKQFRLFVLRIVKREYGINRRYQRIGNNNPPLKDGSQGCAY